MHVCPSLTRYFYFLLVLDYTPSEDSSVGQFALNRTAETPGKMDSWGEWSPWTRCSRECGGGRQSRMRDCIQENQAKINCTGDRVQIQECNTHQCPGKHAYA